MRDFYKHMSVILLLFILWLGLAQLKDPLIMVLTPLYITILVAGLYIIKYYENIDLSLEILKKERVFKSFVFILFMVLYHLLKLHHFFAIAFSIAFYLFFSLFLLEALLFNERIKKKEGFYESNN